VSTSGGAHPYILFMHYHSSFFIGSTLWTWIVKHHCIYSLIISIGSYFPIRRHFDYKSHEGSEIYCGNTLKQTHLDILQKFSNFFKSTAFLKLLQKQVDI
jgi:hypothetical protein